MGVTDRDTILVKGIVRGLSQTFAWEHSGNHAVCVRAYVRGCVRIVGKLVDIRTRYLISLLCANTSKRRHTILFLFPPATQSSVSFLPLCFPHQPDLSCAQRQLVI